MSEMRCTLLRYIYNEISSYISAVALTVSILPWYLGVLLEIIIKTLKFNVICLNLVQAEKNYIYGQLQNFEILSVEMYFSHFLFEYSKNFSSGLWNLYEIYMRFEIKLISLEISTRYVK